MLRELRDGVAGGSSTAVELVERALERIERLDGVINAVVALRADEALAEAGALDERARRGERLGPLGGIPFLVKDSMHLAGLPTTWGSRTLAGAPPAERDCLTVARLRAAGAVPVGKTNVPEHCFEGFTANGLFGTTRNPWAPEWTPGGSSGGSAAAMAAGYVPFATATDGGGSVRIPAAFCGLYGLKPSHGLIGRDDAPGWLDFTTDGPLAVCAADLRLLLGVMAGPAAGDPTSLPAWAAERIAGSATGAPAAHGTVAGTPAAGAPATDAQPDVRVLAAPRLVDWGPLPPAIEALFTAALEALERDLGLAVERIEAGRVLRGDGLPGANADDDWVTTVACEQAHQLGRAFIEENEERFDLPFRAAMRLGLGVTIDEYIGARRRRYAYARALDELLSDGIVLATPTMPFEGFTADGRMPGAERPGTDSAAYNNQVQNMTGHPALTVPAGRAPNGVPFGLQLTAPRFCDDLLLGLAEAWDRAHPQARVAPGYEEFWPD